MDALLRGEAPLAAGPGHGDGPPCFQEMCIRDRLWTDPKALPPVGDVDAAWALYLRTWRPGKPKPDSWAGLYQRAMAAVQARIDRSAAHVATVD